MKIVTVRDKTLECDSENKPFSNDFKSRTNQLENVYAVQLGYFEYGFDMILALVPQSEEKVWIHSTLAYQSDLVDKTGQCLTSVNLYRCSAYFAVLPDGTQVFTDYQNNCVKCVNPSGEVSELFTTRPLRPSGICVTNNDRGIGILVSLEDNVSYQPTPASLRMVRQYSLKGDIISIYRCDELSQDETPLFNRPDAIVQNQNKDICVVNRTGFDSGEVCIVTEDGNLKSRYQGNNITFDPCDICCDSKMNIIVSDYSNTCVHFLNSDGEFSHYLLTKQTLLGDPWSVGIYDDCLWVGCNRGKVQRFRLIQNRQIS